MVGHFRWRRERSSPNKLVTIDMEIMLKLINVSGLTALLRNFASLWKHSCPLNSISIELSAYNESVSASGKGRTKLTANHQNQKCLKRAQLGFMTSVAPSEIVLSSDKS